MVILTSCPSLFYLKYNKQYIHYVMTLVQSDNFFQQKYS